MLKEFLWWKLYVKAWCTVKFYGTSINHRRTTASPRGRSGHLVTYLQWELMSLSHPFMISHFGLWYSWEQNIWNFFKTNRCNILMFFLSHNNKAPVLEKQETFRKQLDAIFDAELCTFLNMLYNFISFWFFTIEHQSISPWYGVYDPFSAAAALRSSLLANLIHLLLIAPWEWTSSTNLLTCCAGAEFLHTLYHRNLPRLIDVITPVPHSLVVSAF